MRWPVWALLSGVFGFAGGFAARPAKPLVREAVAAPLAPPSASNSCTDELAMAANANLTEQVGVYQRRWLAATDPTAIAKPEDPQRAEVARLAKDDTMRLRTPCASFSTTSRFEKLQPGGGGGSVGMLSHRYVPSRAEVAGLRDFELDALNNAYERAHAKTWAAMKDACPDVDAGNDWARIRKCRGILDPDKDALHGALLEAAAARSAGKPLFRPSPEARVLEALAASQDVLVTEMTNAIGAEATRRAMDYGVVCLDDLVVHAPIVLPIPEIPSVDVD